MNLLILIKLLSGEIVEIDEPCNMMNDLIHKYV